MVLKIGLKEFKVFNKWSVFGGEWLFQINEIAWTKVEAKTQGISSEQN